jgi:hypothetical protein
MDLYLLAINFIVADKLLGGIPSRVIEHVVINNAMSLTWWGATNLLYGAGYLAMLPFREVEVPLEYSLLDSAMCNEYVIEHKHIPDTKTEPLPVSPNISSNSVETAPKSPDLHEWEVVNRDENKVLLSNNKDSNVVIITKKEVDDMIIINKE